MVSRIPSLRDLADTVGQHHERIDGSGYPAGTRGAELTQAARILAVVDSFDAMTTTRAYRRALDHSEAVAELRAGAGSQFDGEMVGVFLQVQERIALADTEHQVQETNAADRETMASAIEAQ
jgi:HD-GYP domain-containing protein (c-di-GMP phosphodiesterase class II)